jgi:putative methionine-R-sulfoxide reductase with GAF domain
MPHLRASDVTFFQLKTTVFCVQCELLSYNNSSNCLACGSSAILSLSHLLGGSIGHQERARLISDEQIDRAVENILQKSDTKIVSSSSTAASSFAGQTAAEESIATSCRTLPNALPLLQSAMRWIVERACTITRADGAALAISRRGKLICHAHAGSSVPDLGVELNINHGISGLCARTGMSWKCDSSESDPHVDRISCRELGTQSVLAAPVSHLNSVLGVLEVFSSQMNAFNDQDVASLQLLSGLLVVAITRGTKNDGWYLPRAEEAGTSCRLLR